MGFIALWLIFAVVVAVAANSRGRSPVGWFVLACIISPLIAAIALALMPTRQGDEPSWLEQREGRARKCPFCAEYIKREAVVCKHCGRDIPQIGKTEPAPKISKLARAYIEAQDDR